jgi:hypothetical protein
MRRLRPRGSRVPLARSLAMTEYNCCVTSSTSDEFSAVRGSCLNVCLVLCDLALSPFATLVPDSAHVPLAAKPNDLLSTSQHCTCRVLEQQMRKDNLDSCVKKRSLCKVDFVHLYCSASRLTIAVARPCERGDALCRARRRPVRESKSLCSWNSNHLGTTLKHKDRA